MDELMGPEFWARVAGKQKQGQRKGQAVFNVAADMFPAECRTLTGSYVDPFYNDRYISSFLDALVNMVTEPGNGE